MKLEQSNKNNRVPNYITDELGELSKFHYSSDGVTAVFKPRGKRKLKQWVKTTLILIALLSFTTYYIWYISDLSVRRAEYEVLTR